LYLENDIDQSNHDTVSLLKEKYKSEIILPLTHYQLTSRLINENTSFRVTLQELQNFSIITDSLHSGDHDEEYSRKIHEIIKILREISKKDLKILRVYPGISEVHDLCDTKWAW
jgi:hypothetical protein